ncbi:MAG: YifB family Mg chelatase-like AAA ATPase [Treponemataceae bacterium]|nr:MAG: YifB family Mg chelatase-like AAA ATPase [Treponemataceae bacterium]
MRIYSFSPFGYEGALVMVEVDMRRGIPAIDMVGLADGTVRESRERMRMAIINSGFEFPCDHILISLSPADIKKEGAGFDLAIAVALLTAANEKADSADSTQSDSIPDSSDAILSDSILSDSILIMGELELSGNIRPVRGVFAAASSAYEAGIKKCIVPSENFMEANFYGMSVMGAKTLQEAFDAALSGSFRAGSPAENIQDDSEAPEFPVEFPSLESLEALETGGEYAEVHGQQKLLRALQIAAAGRHNLLAFGPPGCGKTLALSRFSALLPLLTPEEARSVTRIHSLAGDLPHNHTLMRVPPFRSPNQSTSFEGMTGGGKHCSPGEVSLAHNGVLFLDEAAEYNANVLQSLRVPLESSSVTLSRAGKSSTYPASFQLLAASNPCPCGNFGSENKICLCSVRSVETYWRKFSAPLLDRIDIRVPVFMNDNTATHDEQTVSTAELRVDIARAVAIQRKRQNKRNRFLHSDEIEKYCTRFMEEDAREALTKACEKYNFSQRGIASCKKLARTIADMSGSEKISATHVAEAVFFRKSEGGMGILQ